VPGSGVKEEQVTMPTVINGHVPMETEASTLVKAVSPGMFPVDFMFNARSVIMQFLVCFSAVKYYIVWH
jgi:hypothetical protein